MEFPIQIKHDKKQPMMNVFNNLLIISSVTFIESKIEIGNTNNESFVSNLSQYKLNDFKIRSCKKGISQRIEREIFKILGLLINDL